MSRNVKKELEWLKENYIRKEVRIKKEVGKKFTEKLKKDGYTFNDWCNNEILKYIEK